MSTSLEQRSSAAPDGSAAAEAAAARPAVSTVAVRYATLGLQLILVLLVIRTYQLESRTFYNVSLLAVGGFAVNAALPRAYRLPFFALLSMAGAVVAFGWAGGTALLGTGLVLIAACHLPIRWGYRIAVLAGLGTVLALGRAEVLPFGWDTAVWAILGSMFMFRLALYMHALRQDSYRFDPWRTLAYFFMLPNVVFPLYPVVDYTAFERNHYDEDELGIYETGVHWIARGLLQLVLYRFVYQFVVLDAGSVVSLTELIQFLLGTFLLYLRVSGSFHLIVGVLYLFGFRLPETHHLYYLASGFTDFWRRINIYWKDFMMKLVYYPSFFRLRRWGTERALVAATIIVFLATWILHSYQWFWLRGGFPLTAQDLLFWGLLGALVVRASLKEMRKPRARTLGAQGWSAARGLRTLGTFAALCVLWSLWSSESVIEWLWMWRAALNAGPAGLSLLTGLVVAGVLVGGRNWGAPVAAGERRSWLFQPTLRAAATLVLLLGLAQTERYDDAAPRLAGVFTSLQSTTLNRRDTELQHRGYYEKLDNPGRMSANLWTVLAEKPADWVTSREAGLLEDRDDFLGWGLIPSLNSSWNGVPVSINRWGMRDRDYSLRKPDGTFRIALLGQSHVMGTYLADDQVFDNVLEDRLNGDAAGPRVEVLNFAVTDYALTQQAELVRARALDFEPDVVILTLAPEGRLRVVRHLLGVAYSDAEVPDAELAEMLRRMRLAGLSEEGLPLPFESLRTAAGWLGLTSRMPYNEALARARYGADAFNRWALEQSARRAREAGATPALLVLGNVNSSTEPLPEMRMAEEAGMVILNLLDVYGDDRDQLRIAPWDGHPNAEAHRRIAARLQRELERAGLLDPETRPPHQDTPQEDT